MCSAARNPGTTIFMAGPVRTWGTHLQYDEVHVLMCAYGWPGAYATYMYVVHGVDGVYVQMWWHEFRRDSNIPPNQVWQ